MSDLPSHYFRVREPGAAVYRVDAENRQRRLEMEPVAVVNLRNGQVRAQGDRTLTDHDHAAIDAWIAERRAVIARREVDDVLRTIDHLNHLAHWAQSQAPDAVLERFTDDLLLAMHDLRGVLVRRKADRMERATPSDAPAAPG